MRDKDVAKVGKALAHPMKVAIIRDLRTEGKLSPIEWTEEHGVPLQNGSYHFTSLRKLGILKPAGTAQRRGALEHYYRLAGAKADAVLRVLDTIDGVSPSDSQ